MTVGGRMNPEDVDRVRSALDAVHERISTALFQLDAHPRLGFLREEGLTGATARFAGEVPAALPGLWQRFTLLGHYLDEAKHVRARRTWLRGRDRAELTRLLRGKVVAVDLHGAPLAEEAAGPPARQRPARRLTLTEFAHELEQVCTRYLRRLDRLDTAIGEVADEVAALESTLTRAQARAVTLGVSEAGDAVVAELTAARTELDRLHHRSMADPLAADRPTRHGTRPYTAAIDAVQERLAELARLRDEHPQRLAQLRKKIDEVAAAEADAAAAYETAQAKIADPDLPPAPAAAPELRQQLSTVEELARAGGWPRFGHEVASVEQAGVAAYRYARRLRASATGLLDRRAELRGRLAALAAMAAQTGHAEHPELSAGYERARRLLHTQPCNLPAATQAMAQYQRLLTELVGRPEEEHPPEETQ